ncbi:MAG: alpha/beta hydrolase [Bdellovibrionales bacterium]|nr:alpha/beta hydrolase [Bdellovibrionales bacterium]
MHLQGHWVRQGPLAGQGAATAPWFLVGHSLGALTSLAWILRGKRSGLEPEFARRAFISAPPLRLRMAVPAWKASMARWLGSTLPDITIANGISPDDLSYDAANVAAYRADPLVHGHASPRNYLSMLAKAAEVLDRPQDVEIPVCLAVGADDPVCDPATTRAYYGALGTHKKFFEFPHAKHEILNETSRRRCFEELAAWFL